MKAKCANCNNEMSQEHSGNWKAYCMKDECKKAAMDEMMKPKKKRM
jgi:hypothetical protein